MTIACPCCRAGNETTTCRRCKADLSLLAAIEARRTYLLGAARTTLGRGEDASPMIEEAESLRNGSDAAQLRAVAALMRGEYAAAMALHGEPTVSTVG